MILIIGAGLSGLLTGYRLKQKGIPFKILEARDRIGGRINTSKDSNNTLIEMGATWFQYPHKHLIMLLKELEIESFEQHMDAKAFFQSSPNSPTRTIEIPAQAPSYRISGGTFNLINTLYHKLDKSDILLNKPVTEIRFLKNSVQVIAKEIFEAEKVVLAIPPKLWAKKITFEPELPSDLIDVAKNTHTWMEDSIKMALTFKSPFWEQDNIPGTLFSNPGPVTEFYDHCDHKRFKYALCGFINSSFKNLSDVARKDSVMNQLITVFGEKVKEFIDYKECIWSEEEHTFEESEDFLYPHHNNGNPIFRQSFFNDKLIISSSESASEFPGYMEGAVYSGNITAEKIMNQ